MLLSKCLQRSITLSALHYLGYYYSLKKIILSVVVLCNDDYHSGGGWIAFQEWWTHLWLNEGFASWIEYLCVDHCFPEYDIWTQFATSDYTRALELDALKNSHPIEVLVVFVYSLNLWF